MLSQRQSYILWTFCTVVATYFISLTAMDTSTHQSKELTRLINADVKELSTRPELKTYLHGIQTIEKIGSDEVSNVWARFVQNREWAKREGRYKLELLFIAQNDEGLKAIVQFHFVDLKTGDSVEEFARYYDLKSVL